MDIQKLSDTATSTPSSNPVLKALDRLGPGRQRSLIDALARGRLHGCRRKRPTLPSPLPGEEVSQEPQLNYFLFRV